MKSVKPETGATVGSSSGTNAVTSSPTMFALEEPGHSLGNHGRFPVRKGLLSLRRSNLWELYTWLPAFAWSFSHPPIGAVQPPKAGMSVGVALGAVARAAQQHAVCNVVQSAVGTRRVVV